MWTQTILLSAAVLELLSLVTALPQSKAVNGLPKFTISGISTLSLTDNSGTNASWASLPSGFTITDDPGTNASSTLNVGAPVNTSNTEHYHIEGTDVDLMLYGFGAAIPPNNLREAMNTLRTNIAVTCARRAHDPIDSGGHFVFRFWFASEDKDFEIHMNDLREAGRTLDFKTLWNALEGLRGFETSTNLFKELHFTVDVQGTGMVAIGFIQYSRTPSVSTTRALALSAPTLTGVQTS